MRGKTLVEASRLGISRPGTGITVVSPRYAWGMAFLAEPSYLLEFCCKKNKNRWDTEKLWQSHRLHYFWLIFTFSPIFVVEYRCVLTETNIF